MQAKSAAHMSIREDTRRTAKMGTFSRGCAK